MQADDLWQRLNPIPEPFFLVVKKGINTSPIVMNYNYFPPIIIPVSSKQYTRIGGNVKSFYGIFKQIDYHLANQPYGQPKPRECPVVWRNIQARTSVNERESYMCVVLMDRNGGGRRSL